MMNITFMLSACCILKMHCTYYLPCSPSLGSGPLWGCVFSASSSLFFLFCSCSINSSIVNVKTSWYFLSLSLLLIQFVTSLSVNGLILVFGATKYKYSMLAVCKQRAYNDDFQIKNILKYYMEPIWHHAYSVGTVYSILTSNHVLAAKNLLLYNYQLIYYISHIVIVWQNRISWNQKSFKLFIGRAIHTFLWLFLLLFRFFTFLLDFPIFFTNYQPNLKKQ